MDQSVVLITCTCLSTFLVNLQSKDKLIASLKDGVGPNEGSTASGLELEEIRNERDSLREELQMASGRLQQVRSELQVTADPLMGGTAA